MTAPRDGREHFAVPVLRARRPCHLAPATTSRPVHRLFSASIPNNDRRLQSTITSSKMDQIERAMADLRLQDKPNIQATANKFNIDRTTLSRHWRGVQRSKEDGYDSQRLIDTAQSQALIKYINDLTERGLPPTNHMVRTFASHIAGRLPGPHWTSRWVKAHNGQLKSAYLCTIDSTRKKADSALYYSLYFELLARKIAEYNIQPQNMYNVDEKGFLIGYLQKTKRVFTKSAFDAGQI